MSVNAASVVVSGSTWTVFWVQLPALVLATGGIVAWLRAPREDMARMFETFAGALGRKRHRRRRTGNNHKPQSRSTERGNR
ncbi:hypothetical protein [Nocardia heshunensis]